MQRTRDWMLRRITCSVALSAGKADCSRLLSNNIAADRSPYIAIQTQLWVRALGLRGFLRVHHHTSKVLLLQVQQHCSFTSSSGWLLQQPQQQIRQLLHHRSRLTPAAADAALVQSPPVAGQQWQQQRMLLGAVKHRNYQDHNKQKAKKYKIKTPS